MNAKKIICITIAIVLFASFFSLARLLLQDKQNLHLTSYPRFVSLLIVHLVAVCYDFIFVRLDQLKDILRWAFFFSVNITAFLTMTQLHIFHERNTYMRESQEKYGEPLQLIYLNSYFLLYLFAVTLSFILTIVMLTLCCVECIRQRRIRLCLERNVTKLQYTSQMQVQQCPICLSAFRQGQALSQITCKHIFHDSCLKDWIKINSTCPNCRFNLFSQFNAEELAQAREAL